MPGSVYFVQKVYTFVSASFYRWNVWKSHLQRKKTVKRIDSMWWSASASAILASKEAYSRCSRNDHARAEAKSLSKMFKRYGSAVPSLLWNRLLQRANSVIGHSNRNVVTYGCNILNFSLGFHHWSKKWLSVYWKLSIFFSGVWRSVTWRLKAGSAQSEKNKRRLFARQRLGKHCSRSNKLTHRE
jgi:hypothetical protein